uniref:Uncharacterized protein AlNc14C99G5970 n=1 Tax=Albugo laibachii Nc14 TaxID=890382 RepID=F0WHA4_9STRA|nr:conserved hypothetical protein [Albugo laibachii Nc14]|eukprot:CCA20620.1 conserved hypothetical protein [Albugo laibachii Nc14]
MTCDKQIWSDVKRVAGGTMLKLYPSIIMEHDETYTFNCPMGTEVATGRSCVTNGHRLEAEACHPPYLVLHVDMAQQDSLSTDNVGVEFDPSTYASLLKKELITYSFTWDPLLQILQTLGASSTKVHNLQQTSSLKLAELENDLHQFQNQMENADIEKKVMLDTVARLQEQVEKLQIQTVDTEKAKEMQHASTDESSQTSKSKEMHHASTDESSQTSYNDTIPMNRVDTDGEVTTAVNSFEDDVGAKGKMKNDKSDPQFHELISDFVRKGDLEEVKLYLLEKLEDKGTLSEIVTVEQPDKSESTRAVPNTEPGFDDSTLQARLENIEEAFKLHGQMLQEMRAAVASMQISKPAHFDKVESQIENLEAAKTFLEEALQRTRKDNEQQAISCDQVRGALSKLEREIGRQSNDLERCQGKMDEDRSDLRRVKGSLDDLILQHRTLGSLKQPLVAQSDTEESKSRDNGLSETPPAVAQYDFSMIFQRLSDIRQFAETSIEGVQGDMANFNARVIQHEDMLSTLNKNTDDQLSEFVECVRSQLEAENNFMNSASNDVKAQKGLIQNVLEQIESMEKADSAMDVTGGKMRSQIEQLIRIMSNTLSKSSACFAGPDLVMKNLTVISANIRRMARKLKVGLSDLGSSETSEILHQLRLLDDDTLGLTQRSSLLEHERNLISKNTEDMHARLLYLWPLWASYNVQKSTVAEAKDVPFTSSHSENIQSTPTFVKDLELVQSRFPHDAEGLAHFDTKMEELFRRVDAIESQIHDRAKNLTDIESSHKTEDRLFVESAELDQLRQEMFDEIAKLSDYVTNSQKNRSINNNDDARLAQSDHHSPMTQPDYDSLVHLVVQRVTETIGNESREQIANSVDPRDDTEVGKSGHGSTPNFNNLAVLDKIMQQVDKKTSYLQDWNSGEIARIRKELLEHLRRQLEEGLRELRAELSIYYPMGPMDDTTAIGTKATVCIACSRPVPVSPMIREGPIANELTSEQTEVIIPQQQEQDVDRSDEDFVYRGGFRMPVQDRKNMTLPFLVHNPRPRQVPQSERNKPRPPLRGSPNRIDTVFKEAMDLERNIRSRFQEQSNQK